MRPVIVAVWSVRDRDCDNLKTVLDVLEGRVIENDRRVVALHVFRAKDRERRRVEVEVCARRQGFSMSA